MRCLSSLSILRCRFVIVLSILAGVEKITLDRLRANLLKLREMRELSQEDVAHLAGIDYKFYQSIEAGRRKELRVSTIERIAKAYGLEAHQLLAPRLPKIRAAKKEKKSYLKKK